MKRTIYKWSGIWATIWMLLPSMVQASGDKATNIVVVADTRRVTGVMHYFANLYNTDIVMFAVWTVVLTAAMGCTLGFLMDFIMSRTGLDLKSRKIVEH
ncbi:DVU0150 family protein [uncultured Desulfosarcina sp.]|uniref:DVU0150 family protein n=1 Tax=uncultured Desulfosarcina sp. TaxID=218289 RepID=UPI0029C74A50|nr:DVU0150 family protein [uncultured Desulfosarcina sp.]